MSQRRQEAAEWKHKQGGQLPDPARFREDIQPRLQSVPLSALVKVTGLSLRYCALIRRGERIRHPLYWDALRELVGTVNGIT